MASTIRVVNYYMHVTLTEARAIVPAAVIDEPPDAVASGRWHGLLVWKSCGKGPLALLP